ncbi:MAG TPA: hypothetical protein VK430_05540 [Xanthobacteraceae bacterium]|nr:hypothetical protein [Xanthobacteraceae bacterium]
MLTVRQLRALPNADQRRLPPTRSNDRIVQQSHDPSHHALAQLLPRAQRKDQSDPFIKLDAKTIDLGALPADFAELARGLGPHLFEVDLESPHRHGEFGTQPILVRPNLVYVERGCFNDMPLGDPHGAFVNERNKQQHQETTGQHPDAEQHQRFDHSTGTMRPRGTNLSRHAGRFQESHPLT